MATLRDEPSTASLSAAFTQKASRDNVVKVDGLATAIARAGEVIRERVRGGSRPDIFEALVATDDASGPALYQPYTPTPVPPRSSSIPPAPPSTVPFPMRALAPPPLPRLDHPGFAVLPPSPPPSFAPARPRRGAFGAFAIAFVAPLVLVVLALGVIGYSKARKPKADAVTSQVGTPVKAETPAPIATPSTPVAAPSAPLMARGEEPMLVVEVKSLKSAPSSPRKRR